MVDALPRGHLRVPYRGGEYFFHDGYWYRPDGPRYVLVVPPRRVRVRSLPPYAEQVWLGSVLYFLAAGTYYLWHADTREYEVVSRRRGQRDPFIRSAGRPPATTWWPTRARPGARPAEPRPLRVPPLGGGRERLRPGGATYAPAAEVANGYRRAMAACLSGRGYSVN